MATWERLAHVALSGTADTISSGTFSAYEFLKVQVFTIASGENTVKMQLNNDTGANYAYRISASGGADSTQTSIDEIHVGQNSGDGTLTNICITNVSDKEKLVISHSMERNSTGAGYAPARTECVGKWANTSANITEIDINNTQSGDFAAGSYITVWGAKPAPTTADVITVDSLEAKKHLMVQGNLLNSGELNTVALQFNSDTGNNYSRRYSIDGGADATDTSQPSLEIEQGSAWSGDCFFTTQIINEATKEKLVKSEWIDQQSTGTGSVPRRAEVVGKWSNTSNAITTIKVIQGGGGSFAEGSEVTVYGTD